MRDFYDEIHMRNNRFLRKPQSKPTPFSDKVVWITGASSGIGAALAIALSRSGAMLILSGRDRNALKNVKRACCIDADVVLQPFDLADLDGLNRQAERALQAFGHIDYMIHNAGIASRDRVETTELCVDQKIMATNYFGAVCLTRALLPSMRQRSSGCFVVVSSLLGKHGGPQASSYSASKHALHGFFESLRAEVHDDNIRVTMVVPGFIRTPIITRAVTGGGGRYGKTLAVHKRGMDPEQCAARILKAAAARKEEVLVGGVEIYSAYLKRFFPTLLSAVIRSHPAKVREKLLSLIP